MNACEASLRQFQTLFGDSLRAIEEARGEALGVRCASCPAGSGFAAFFDPGVPEIVLCDNQVVPNVSGVSDPSPLFILRPFLSSFRCALFFPRFDSRRRTSI